MPQGLTGSDNLSAWLSLLVVADVVTATTCETVEIGARMRAARVALGLTQEGLAQAVAGSKPGIRDNEGGKNVPGGKVIFGLISLGINANWLLTGEGPMLLKDLAPVAVAEQPLQVKINVKALAAAIDAMRKLAEPGETPESTATKTAKFYQYLLDQGLITPTGVGEGILKKAG